MIFKYELRFVAFTWPNLCSLMDLSLLFIVLVGRKSVSGSDILLLKKRISFIIHSYDTISLIYFQFLKH